MHKQKFVVISRLLDRIHLKADFFFSYDEAKAHFENLLQQTSRRESGFVAILNIENKKDYIERGLTDYDMDDDDTYENEPWYEGVTNHGEPKS